MALVHVYTVLCTHTSDPVSLHCNHGLYSLAVADRVCSFRVTLPEASTARDGMDFHTQGDQVQPLVCHLVSDLPLP